MTVIPANAAGAQKVERLTSVVFTKVVLESIEEAGVKKIKNPCPKSFQAARRLIKTPDEREQNKTRPTCWPGEGWRRWALLSQQSGKENPSSICWRPPAEEASAGNQGSRVIIRRGRCRQHSSGWRRLRSRCCRSGIDFRKRFRGFRGVGCNVIK